MRIVHVGAWNRNWGDAAIQLACRVAAGEGHEWLPYDCQTTVFTKELVEEIEKDGPCVWLIGGGGLIWWKPELESVSGWQWQITPEALDAIQGRIVVWAVGSPIFPHGDRTWFLVEPWAEEIRASLMAVADQSSTFTVRGESTRNYLVVEGIRPTFDIVPDIAWGLVDYLMPASPGPLVGVVWAEDKPDWRWGTLAREESVRDALAQECLEATVITHLADESRGDWLGGRMKNCWIGDPVPDHVGAWAHIAYGDLRCVVSARKHGIILAAAMGVPVVGIGDVVEVREICETIGAPCLPTDWLLGPGRLTAAIERTVAYRDSQQRLAREASHKACSGLRDALNKAWSEIE